MAKYAEGTKVLISKSRADIERLLQRYGASSFIYGSDEKQSLVGFTAQGRQVKFVIPHPTIEEVSTQHMRRSTQDAQKAELRRRWRVLCIRITAKLEAIDGEDATFDEEFMANIVMPGGELFGAHAIHAIQSTYETGTMPKLLPAMGET